MTPNDRRRLPAGFTRLVWSNLAAQSAEQIGLAAAPIVAVLALGAGVAGTGALQTAQTLPFVLFAIPAGLLADRRSRRMVMTAAEALRTLSLPGGGDRRLTRGAARAPARPRRTLTATRGGPARAGRAVRMTVS